MDMKQMKHVFSVVVSVAMMVAMVFVVPVQAAGNYVAQLYGKVTDAGQVVNKVVIDYGDGEKYLALIKILIQFMQLTMYRLVQITGKFIAMLIVLLKR